MVSMSDIKSLTPLEAVDKYFDMLIKSRFIEMFGTLDAPKTRFERLGDVATYVNGYAFKPSDWGTEGLPIIRIQNLSGSGDSFNYYSGTYPQTIEINKGDIMISWSATLGVFIWNGPKALLNQHIFKVCFDKMEINPTFFRIAVEPALKRSSSQVHGSTMTHLTKKTFDSIQIPIPPIDLQNEFASFVQQTDESKAICKRIFESFDNLVKSRFNELFGDCPKERLGNHCSTHARIGWQKLTKKEFLKTGDYYLVTGWDIMPDHRINFEQCYYVTKERYEQDQKLILAEGDVLLTKDGTIGKIGLIENTDKPATLNGHIFVIRSKDGTLLPRFLVGLFGTSDFKNQIESNRTGSTITGITQKSLLEFMIPIAPLDRQQEYVDFVKQVDKSKFEVVQSLTRLLESVKIAE